jgi:hypothetical protein
VKNKGAYIAEIGISYYDKKLNQVQEKFKLLSLQSKKFFYPADSVAAVVFGQATAGKEIFMLDLIGKKETEVCIDVYGVLLGAKSTRVNCPK